ncbi:hypothetical protein AB0K60_04765 [Thermopolyspora sp. NPDC052614]|uniref:hypothetical protein n=1 Tax=Thermopolyspora sp. NPDC052614 TaxID=3155682 RepID=UPI00343AF6BA
MRIIREQVRGYLGDHHADGPEKRADGSVRRVSGRALALVGDYGSGKSHIAYSVAKMLRDARSVPVMWLIDEPVLDFGTLYSDRLVSDLNNQKAEFYEILIDYYSDVTADSLERTDKDVAAGLRGHNLDPQAVIEAYTLSEAAIRRDLERRLKGITDHGKFSAALAMLQFPEFQDAVWEWLMGHPPDDILVERGIDQPIAGVTAVFDALAVFAFLYGQAGRRFALIIDSVEKSLDWPQDQRIAFMQGFERLVSVYVSVGGLLVFCVLPDALAEFPESLHERIRPIRPTSLTNVETWQLVSHYLRGPASVPMTGSDAGKSAPVPPTPAVPDVTPFTPESVEYIRTLAGGVPRRVLKLCHHAWQVAARRPGPERPIDDVAIRTAVREAFQTATREHVRATIEEVLETGPWRYQTSAERFANRRGGPATEADFWIPVGRSGATIAVISSDSILLNRQVDHLKDLVDAVRADAGNSPVIVLAVVNGYLAAAFREPLANVVGTKPIVYDERRFRTMLRNAIQDAVARLENAGRDDALALLQDRLQGIAYQQTNMLEYLQRIDGRVERFDSASSARLSEMLRLMSGQGEGAARGEWAAGASRRLPEEIQRHFDRAFDAVGLMSGVPTLFRDAFDPKAAARGRSEVHPRRLGFTAEQFQAVGVAVLLEKLLEAFRDGVGEWLRDAQSSASTSGEGASGEGVRYPSPAQERSLQVMCRTYEITAEMLPVFRLESLAAFGIAGRESEPLEQRSRSFRRAEAEDALSRLGDRVFKSTLSCLRVS